ncbi:MAG TPA: hypothetical protein VH143_15380 [Kofleriaceae bacterium]|nr:hypothetical protein [Kofleriaceae bacterium]
MVEPLIVPALPPGHVTEQPEPHPVTVHVEAHVTSHDDASAQSMFALEAVVAITMHGWPTSQPTTQLSFAAHSTLHDVP